MGVECAVRGGCREWGAARHSPAAPRSGGWVQGAPGRGVGGGGAGGAVTAKAEPKADSTVTWALRGFRSVREHCVVAS
jgi:hypothetical protein